MSFSTSPHHTQRSTLLRRIALASAAFLLLPALASAEEPIDWEMVNKIRDEGFHRSQVMETARYLTEDIGARLTGSPSNQRAFEWTRDKLAEWGLENAHLEEFDFGHGWSFDRATVHMLSPHSMPLSVLPQAWTPGTDGVVRGMAMHLKLESEEDLEKHAGKLAGKILFVDEMAEAAEFENTPFRRWNEGQLEDKCSFDIPMRREQDWRKRMKKRVKMRERLKEYLVEEGVIAVVEASSRGNGVLRLGGGGSGGDPERHRGITELTMIHEHYNRVLRLLEDDREVELEVEVSAQFHDDTTLVHNTIAELPGSSHADEVVMLGGHLDSWHAGTGATDNAAGSVVMMEAIRILKAIGAKPKRTIRIALWNGEEQGLNGSRAYVKQHFATRPEPDEEQMKLPRFLREQTWPIEPKADHENFSVYFNVDNGGGKIRGIYTQENAAALPLFEAWLQPFHDLGADTVTTNRTGGTDHLSFDAVGLPGFQFVQDPMDYSPRTHHTHIDTFEHLVPEDLMQASVVVASFVYHAANRDELFPRKPIPQEPPEDPRKKDDEEEDEEEAEEAEADEAKAADAPATDDAKTEDANDQDANDEDANDDSKASNEGGSSESSNAARAVTGS